MLGVSWNELRLKCNLRVGSGAWNIVLAITSLGYHLDIGIEYREI